MDRRQPPEGTEAMSIPIETLLIVDTETTGIEFEENAPIEIGAILFDVKHRAMTHQLSMLLPSHVPNGAEAINRIPEALVGEAAPSAVRGLADESLRMLDLMHRQSDAVLAHNMDFDRQWIRPLVGEVIRDGQPIPWLCTMRDFRWGIPGLRSTPSVIDLALAHSVPVWAAHRALTDCTYLAQVLAGRHDLEALLLDAQTPQHLYEALVPYSRRGEAKAAGFQWQAHRPNAWTRMLREEEAAALPFEVVRIDA